MFYSVGIFRTSSLVDSISSNPEVLLRAAPKRQAEEPGYMEVLQKKKNRAGSHDHE